MSRQRLISGLVAAAVLVLTMAPFVGTSSAVSVVQVTKLTASDGQDWDGFGTTVAASGDVLAIGAPEVAPTATQMRGAVYVFEKDAAGVWQETAKIRESHPLANNRRFGSASLALDGNLLVVVSAGGGVCICGTLHVFQRVAAGAWVEEARIDGPATEFIGVTLSLDGPRLAAGTSGDRVMTYERVAPGKWVFDGVLVDPTSTASGFGQDVALQGDRAVAVGGPAFTEVAVFDRAGSGVWPLSARAKLPPAATPYPAFSSIAISGSAVAAGASAGTSGGTVHVFQEASPGAWAHLAALVPSSHKSFFGWKMALEGDLGVGGAPHASPKGDRSGAAHVFYKTSGGSWQMGPALIAADGGPFEFFGDAVAIAGTEQPAVVVGARGHVWGGGHRGAVYVHDVTL